MGISRWLDCLQCKSRVIGDQQKNRPSWDGTTQGDPVAKDTGVWHASV